MMSVRDWRTPEPINLPKATVYDLAENVARQVGYLPGANLHPVVENLCGEIVFQDFWSLESTNNGSIEIYNEGNFRIFIPNFVALARNRFTIAHELGHFFLHYYFQGGREKQWNLRASRYTDMETDRPEWEANWFAAAFLMPSNDFRRAWLDYRDLDLVAHKFGVSSSAAGLHAQYHQLN